MARVTGIGGVFLRSTDPERLRRWYADHVGLEPNPAPDDECTTFVWGNPTGTTTWAVFEDTTEYFGPQPQQAMVNYRVDDLDAMLDALRSGGAEVDDHIEEHEFGRFGWAVDCDGNRFELWQPAVDQ